MRTGLVLRAGLPIDTWKLAGERISQICEASAWWIGDWLLFGKDKYPDRYRRAITGRPAARLPAPPRPDRAPPASARTRHDHGMSLAAER